MMFHNSIASSVFPKKNPTAQGSGLSSDAARASATTLFDMDQKYADVVPLGDVSEYLASWRA